MQENDKLNGIDKQEESKLQNIREQNEQLNTEQTLLQDKDMPKNEKKTDIEEQSISEQTEQSDTKQKLLQIVKFVLFSISAGVIQLVAFTLLNELVHWQGKLGTAEYGPNYFIALTLSVLWNFTFNRKFTFKSANNVPIAMLKVFAYYCVFTPLSILWGIALTNKAGWNEYIVLAITMLINMSTEFLVCKFFVYRNSENTNELAKKQQEKRLKQNADSDTVIAEQEIKSDNDEAQND